MGPKSIYARETEYSRRRLNRMLSPERKDAFADKTKDDQGASRSYAEIMRENQLQRETENTMINVAQKRKQDAEQGVGEAQTEAEAARAEKRRNRWDQSDNAKAAPKSDWDAIETTNVSSRWDATPGPASGANASAWDATPGHAGAGGAGPSKRNRWDDATPAHAGEGPAQPKKPRSRWDETPANASTGFGATPAHVGVTPGFFGAATPAGAMGMETPLLGFGRGAAPGGGGVMVAGQQVPMTPEAYQEMRLQKEMWDRNRPLGDEELDALLPGEQDGYKILPPPANYNPVVDPAKKLLGTPAPNFTPFYVMPEDNPTLRSDLPVTSADLPDMKPEDMQYFGKLLQEVDETELGVEEAKERKIMKLLLKVKNGVPSMRKSALRQLTDKARELGAGPLFNQILPLLVSHLSLVHQHPDHSPSCRVIQMQPTLEDQERHLLVKVIDRILYKLDELVRPYVHKILVVIEPLLIDEDYFARVEGREIIANLSKAAGLASMIAAMRPDIDNIDEYVRNTTARAFSVVASALGIPALLPFLKAVCMSKKSWQARHTGIKIIQQIAILMGCAILPHLKSMVDIIKHGLKDENQKVKTITSLCLAALAESASPYGIESFDDVLEPLWRGIRSLRGKVLAAFLKAIGFIIPLMDAEHAFYYTREVMVVLKREFQTPDEEMKKIVLKVVKQCVGTEGVEPEYIKAEVLPEFFRCFWNRRMALDKRNYKALVETTVELSNKVTVTSL